jgi:hypothetical protein
VACLTALLTLCISPLAWGAPPPKKGPPRHPLHGVIRTLDRNRDGQISAAEISKYAAEAIKKLDANKDGRLTRDELRPPRPRLRRRGGQSPAPPLVARDAREKKILAVLSKMRRDQSKA